MKDRSLDEFLDDGTGEPAADTGASEEPRAETGEPEDDAGHSEEHEPATARWAPGGAACAECGETVSRLWNDGGRDCCRSCKEW